MVVSFVSHAGNSISLRGCTMLFQILSDRGQGSFQQQKGDGTNKNFVQRLLIGSRNEATMARRQSHQGEGLQLPRQSDSRQAVPLSAGAGRASWG